MDNNNIDATEFMQCMEEFKASNIYRKKQYYMSLITAVSSILILCVVIYTYITVFPRINNVLDDLSNLDNVMNNIESITKELDNVDIEEMVTVVKSSEQDISDAMTKINSIDIKTLNSAIKELSDVVTPLAKFADRFK